MVAKEVKKAIEKKVKEVKKDAPKPEKKSAKVKVEAKPKVKEHQSKAETKALAPTKKAEAKKEVKAKVEPKVEAKRESAPTKAKEKQDKVADKATSKTKSTGKKGKKKYVLVKAKRKTAVATAKICDGKGRIIINKKPITVIDNKHLYNLVREPLMLVDNFKKGLIDNVDVEIAVRGGGFMSQTIASRGCIAKGIVEFYGDDKLKELFMKYDKSLLVDDARRKEAKKQLGTGARAKKQRSKR